MTHAFRSPLLSTALLCTVSIAPASLAQPRGSGAVSFRQEAARPTPADLPTIDVTADNTVIDISCRVRFPGGPIPDPDGNGVVQIRTDDVTVEFAGGERLRGAEIDENWDTLTGVGVRVENARGVIIRNAHVSGYKVGILATNTDLLTVEDADLSDNYRQRLASTPLREDAADWLFPHHNDSREWVTQHGAALCVERSRSATIRRVRVRRAQNGIILDRVLGSRVYDNDASFLSGWGLACWRSSGNLISRNAFDFCVRGHSEGVYNRGQDSAGILFFEQCNRNTVLDNSATHGGDGFFGFAGREALGQTPNAGGIDRNHLGCNENIFAGNDFSYASAHGWEMTFSEYNRVLANRFVGNAICGIWGGYSGATEIIGSLFEGNGTMAYGEEGGAINIEHGNGNIIRDNTFVNNSVAVRMWWDNDGDLFSLPGTPSATTPITGNVITDNAVTVNADHPFTAIGQRRMTFRGVRFDDPTGARFGKNTYREGKLEIGVDRFEAASFARGTTPEILASTGQPPSPRLERMGFAPLGETNPVGARDHLAGRGGIVMGEWGPWDHESPMIRVRERSAGSLVLECFAPEGQPHAPVFHDAARAGADSSDSRPADRRSGIEITTTTIDEGQAPAHTRVTVGPRSPGATPYDLTLTLGDAARRFAGTFLDTEWEALVWAWTADPRTDLGAWRAEAGGTGVVPATLGSLDFSFRSLGPAELGMISLEAAANAGIGRDRFAIIATTTVELPAGSWRIRTLSDDGIRLFVDGEQRIERWDIHGPTPDETIITLDEPRDVHLRVEHFELDGWAALSVRLEPAE